MEGLTQKALFDFLDEGILTCRERQKKLQDDDRGDEAIFEKIKENVYDIFKKMLHAAIRTSGENEPAVKAFFLQKLEEIPSSWALSYEKAAAHDDVKTMHIEKVKLNVIQEIEAAAARAWEVGK